MRVIELVEKLQLLAHPEGGYYKEVYRSELKIPGKVLNGFTSERNVATSIYFLIEKNNFSALHKIKSDETWHFYAGNALEVIEINDAGELKITCVGSDLSMGQTFQYTVKANTWFGSRVSAGGDFSLVGCTVAPGFDFNDFEMGHRQELLKRFPEHRVLIEQMTRM